MAAAVVLAVAAPAHAAVPHTSAQEGPQGLVAFASDRDGDLEIFVMDADGSDVRQITHNDVPDHSPDWAPDGRRIAFVRQLGLGNDDVYIVDTHTGRERAFTTWRYWYEQDPAWSPNGRWIAFSSRHPDADGGDVEALRIDRKRLRLVATQQENSENVEPAWSPNGKRVAFVDYYEAYDISTTSFWHGYGARRDVTTDGTLKIGPVWSPDGTEILFTRTTAAGKRGLYTVSPSGGPQTIFFEGPVDVWSSSWLAEGDGVVFDAAIAGQYDLYRVDAGGSGLTRLTEDLAADRHPDWSPGPPAP